MVRDWLPGGWRSEAQESRRRRRGPEADRRLRAGFCATFGLPSYVPTSTTGAAAAAGTDDGQGSLELATRHPGGGGPWSASVEWMLAKGWASWHGSTLLIPSDNSPRVSSVQFSFQCVCACMPWCDFWVCNKTRATGVAEGATSGRRSGHRPGLVSSSKQGAT